jgi:hypothetical protein
MIVHVKCQQRNMSLYYSMFKFFGCFGNGTPWNSRNDGQRWVREFRATPFPKQRYTGSLNKNLNIEY